MKKTRTPITVFSLSFLDIISCAFGAVVMLILLAKNGEQGEFNDASQIAELIKALSIAEQKNAALAGQEAQQIDALQAAKAQAASNETKAEALEADLARAKNDVQQLTDKASGLEIALVERKRAAIQVNQTDERDENVGGIPVDSDFVVFVVDTSGSMKNLWPQVMQTMNDLLNTHPEVEGFQILSDNGEVLGGGSGGLRNDNRFERRRAIAQMQRWNGSSNSSPVEGIATALRLYRGKAGNLALYVLGDDYSGGSYDRTLEQINKLNDAGNGNKIARIHGVGFKPNRFGLSSTMVRFSTLMREVAAQNKGTFIAM